MIHRQVFPRIVILLIGLICLSSPVATHAAELVAPGAKVERLAGGFSPTLLIDTCLSRIKELSESG